MTKGTLMLWITEEIAAVFPLTKAFEPVRVWDEKESKFTDEQQTDERGTPIWESEALLKMGWGANLTPIRVRMASRTQPTAKPDPMKLAQMLGMAAAPSAETRREAQHG